MQSVHIHTITTWGGGEGQVLGLVRGLQQAGQRVILFANPAGALLRTGVDGAAVDLRPLPRASAERRLWTPRFEAEQLRGVDVGLVHMHDAHAADIGIPLARHLRARTVLSRRVAFPFRSNPFSRWKYSPGHVSAIVAVSQTVREIVVRSGYPAGRVHVVPSGTDFDEVNEVHADPALRARLRRRWLVGGLGRLTRPKNWDFMVRVAARLRRHGADIGWVIAGEGPDEAALRTLVKTLDLTDSFHFLGFRRDPLRIIASLDLLFHPSLHEGSPGVIREAMALNVPVLTVGAAGSLEVLGGCGWSVDASDVDGAARAILESMTDEPKRSGLVTAARRRVMSHFSMEQTVARTIGVYRSVSAQVLGSSVREQAAAS